MKDSYNGVKLDLEPNSKPYLFKRIVSDGFDTVLIFVLFMILSASVFASPLASVYNTHHENYKRVQNEAVEKYGNDAEAITNKLKSDGYYLDEQFAANLHAYLLKLLSGFIAEAAVLLIVPLVSTQRGTPGKLMTGIIPYNEKKQTRASRPAIIARFIFVFLIDSAFFYLFTGIFTFLLIPVIRLIEMLFNKKNKTICDAVSGIMMIEKLSYDGIDKKTEESK